MQARSQDFSSGAAYLKNPDQIINVWIIRYIQPTGYETEFEQLLMVR